MTPTVELLGSGRRADWLRAWAACGREPFAHPDYVAAFAEEGQQPGCLTVRAATAWALLPVVLRPVPDADGRDTGVRDATSPYGYGGPYLSAPIPADDLWAAVADWLAAEGVLTYFGRLALDAELPGVLPAGGALRSDSSNVVVDLTREPAAQWRHYEHKVRKNVNKARRAGLVVEVREAFTDLTEFTALYRATMERRGAAAWYRFGEDFFDHLTSALRGCYLAAEVRGERGALVSAELVLRSEQHLYSYLGGTAVEAFPHAPNDLLKHAVIEHGHRAGMRRFVLGGGYTPGDGILRYKRAFDPSGEIPFTRIELVGDAKRYRSLTQGWARAVNPGGAPGRLRPGYFPQYRADFVAQAAGQPGRTV